MDPGSVRGSSEEAKAFRGLWRLSAKRRRQHRIHQLSKTGPSVTPYSLTDAKAVERTGQVAALLVLPPRPVYPFVAVIGQVQWGLRGFASIPTHGRPSPLEPRPHIVGQEEMKLALILNVVDPRIGGVMVMGDRGTGKTTAVRALADLLPDIRVRA